MAAATRDSSAGNAIPISARLMAVADVYDALTTHRVYKDAYRPHDQVDRALLLEGRSHFDPDIVDAFAAITEQFREIAGAHGGSAARHRASRLRFDDRLFLRRVGDDRPEGLTSASPSNFTRKLLVDAVLGRRGRDRNSRQQQIELDVVQAGGLLSTFSRVSSSPHCFLST